MQYAADYAKRCGSQSLRTDQGNSDRVPLVEVEPDILVDIVSQSLRTDQGNSDMVFGSFARRFSSSCRNPSEISDVIAKGPAFCSSPSYRRNPSVQIRAIPTVITDTSSGESEGRT